MTLYGFPALTISLDDETPALKDISPFVTTINGWTKEQILEEITAAGNADEVWAVVGLNRVDPVVLGGPYDSVADGLVDVVSITWSMIRTLTLAFGGADTQSVEVYIRKTTNKPERGKLHAFEVELQPTGAVT